ncbi:hypothetical protein [uncultured Aliiroseovarius sp.]|uniref:hypothetical protein n=1 Tax=uncultured Aliiroseovarius sp. TaxID=1658783 RepID=UPI002615CC91|nr:hypothetical protein [uncultured Aliiroseovarius sp.]
MTYDTFFVVGLFILVLATPAILGALRRGATPRIPGLMLLIGGGLIAVAISAKPNAYSISTIPQVIDSVISHLVAYMGT